jgi:hypothetical protein
MTVDDAAGDSTCSLEIEGEHTTIVIERLWPATVSKARRVRRIEITHSRHLIASARSYVTGLQRRCVALPEFKLGIIAIPASRGLPSCAVSRLAVGAGL